MYLSRWGRVEKQQLPFIERNFNLVKGLERLALSTTSFRRLFIYSQYNSFCDNPFHSLKDMTLLIYGNKASHKNPRTCILNRICFRGLEDVYSICSCQSTVKRAIEKSETMMAAIKYRIWDRAEDHQEPLVSHVVTR